MKKTWLIGTGCILAVCLLFSCTQKNEVDREKEIFQIWSSKQQMY